MTAARERPAGKSILPLTNLLSELLKRSGAILAGRAFAAPGDKVRLFHRLTEIGGQLVYEIEHGAGLPAPFKLIAASLLVDACQAYCMTAPEKRGKFVVIIACVRQVLMDELSGREED